MKISFIIPTCRRYETLGRLLYFLSHLEVCENLSAELIIADDGTPNPPADFLSEYEDNLSKIFERIIFHRNPENVGRSRIRNIAIQFAKGDYLLFLDDDTIPALDFLKQLDLYINKFPDKSGILGNQIFQHLDGEKPLVNRYLESRGANRFRDGEQVPWRYCNTCLFLINADLFQITGGFNTDFSIYGGEDTELGLRLHRLGVKFYYAENLKVFHLVDKSLDDMLRQRYLYGKTNLSLIVDNDDVLKREFLVYYIEGLKFGKDSFSDILHKIKFRIMFNRLLKGIVRYTVGVMPEETVDLKLVHYLAGYSYLKGYSDYLKEKQK